MIAAPTPREPLSALIAAGDANAVRERFYTGAVDFAYDLKVIPHPTEEAWEEASPDVRAIVENLIGIEYRRQKLEVNYTLITNNLPKARGPQADFERAVDRLSSAAAGLEGAVQPILADYTSVGRALAKKGFMEAAAAVNFVRDDLKADKPEFEAQRKKAFTFVAQHAPAGP